MPIDPMPKTDAQLPPRYPEAVEIARLRAALDAMTADRDAARAKALEDAHNAMMDSRTLEQAIEAIRDMIQQEDKG